MAEILYGLAAEMLKSLASLAAEQVGSIYGVADELDRFSTTVSSIQAVLIDAEEQQGSSHQVRDWIMRLKKVFIEADDLLDDFATEITHQKSVNKVGIFFSKSNPLVYYLKISRRLKAIRRDMDLIGRDMASLNLVERRQPLLLEPYSVQLNLDRETYSFVPGGEVIGRNDDKKKIMDFLLDSEVEENVVVVSIVGLAGLGKTCLAQCVYNDEMIKSNFDKRLWVCVSDVFEVKMIAEKILESGGGGNKDNYLQLDAVQNELRKMLDGNKYLLVLDDVWNEDALKWSRLKNMLIGGAKGSKILMTTRSDVVAEVSASVHQQKLGNLSNKEAWALFEKMAFQCARESENSNLVEIGKEIARKCGGVPLVIRSVGSLLRLKRTEREWIYFQNQDLSSITRGGNNVMDILRLSYNHLPRHLKICFAYCSLFPKDFEIGRSVLINMWIAQGFIQSTTSNRDNVEEVGNSYFMDLLRRSFFQETEEHESYTHSYITQEYELFQPCKETGERKSLHFYKMHDLIHDLAKEVADREFFSIIKAEDIEIAPDETLHASCLIPIDGSATFPNSFYRKHMKLRTFIYLNDVSRSSVTSNSTLERMISSFARLRVLHLRRLEIEFLPQSLGGLKHLRYLSISSVTIVTLPNSITKLHNLQVLKLSRCKKLKTLPGDIWRLASLRHLICKSGHSLTHIPPGLWQLERLMHLDFTDCFRLEDMPPGIGQLTSLRTLTCFVIGEESCLSGQASDKLNELKGLVDLRNSLSIKFMGRAHAIGGRTPSDVVKRMKHLKQLSVEFDEYGNHEDDTGADLIILEALQPHQNIESLRIENYSGSRFPSWLMVENLGFLLPKLVRLHIGDCHKCQKLPPLWKLPSLQSLGLLNLDGLEGDDDKCMLPSNTLTDECYFSSLKRLELQKISEKILKQILCPPHHPSPLCGLNDLSLTSVFGLATIPEDVFKSLTSLQSLSITNCRDLVSLSTCLTHLTSLKSLRISHCPQLDLSNEEAMKFEAPGKLSTFRVSRLDELMSLPVWLRHFSATLKSIDIWCCPKFATIPEWIGDFIALNRLEINRCCMLTSLPVGIRSLTSLRTLLIRPGSSMLKQRCEKEVGEDWPKIAHIPTVHIYDW